MMHFMLASLPFPFPSSSSPACLFIPPFVRTCGVCFVYSLTVMSPLFQCLSLVRKRRGKGKGVIKYWDTSASLRLTQMLAFVYNNW